MERYSPPFDLTSDMLFAMALGPTAPLRHSFPTVPFLSIGGKTPLVVWFSRIVEACYHDAVAGERRCEGRPTGLYNELNVVALLRQRAVFVPGIYATSERTIALGRQRYGMPKQPTAMRLRVEGRRFEASLADGARQSRLRARLLGSGKPLAKVLSACWPRSTWPARFPAGYEVCPLMHATPRVYVAHVQGGQLALEAAWLPRAVPLLPIGIYAPSLQMRLPP